MSNAHERTRRVDCVSMAEKKSLKQPYSRLPLSQCKRSYALRQSESFSREPRKELEDGANRPHLPTLAGTDALFKWGHPLSWRVTRVNARSVSSLT